MNKKTATQGDPNCACCVRPFGSTPDECRHGRGRRAALRRRGLARSDALIEARGIVKIYPTVSGEPVLALDHLDMAVRDGEFVCLVGPSGCGKSTLLRLLAGLDRADAGAFTLADKRIDGPSAEVGVVFQQATLLPWLTVWQNVTVPLRVGGHRMDGRGARRARSPSHRRAAGLREQVPLRTVRRHAAARRHRAGAGARSEASADGRAVRRARRAHPREDERRAAAHLACAAARPWCSSPIRSTRRCSSATASS